MADVERLLSEYIAEHRAGGEADPLEYLERVEGTDRVELVELIDAYLERSPGREWDATAYRGSDAERVADAITRSLAGQAGWWPLVLPRLRAKMEMTRATVVARLASALDVAGREEKVAGYYNAMEHGTLDSHGVSSRVLAALGDIYGASADYLREISEPVRQGAGGAAGPAAPAMLRKAFPDPEYVDVSVADKIDLPPAPASPGTAAASRAPDRDEVDELFTGGA
jgi:hypothetical protein